MEGQLLRIPTFAIARRKTGAVMATLWSAPLLVASLGPVFGQQAGDPQAGRRLAEARCLQCHGSTAAAAHKAPTFPAVARTPTTTARSLGVFLRTPHPSMPNLILSPAERDDVVAYILSLR